PAAGLCYTLRLDCLRPGFAGVVCMVPALPQGFAAFGNKLMARPYTAGGILIFLALSILFLLRNDSEWEEVYVRGALHWRQGEDIYRAGEGYLYPPFMAWCALPFTFLSEFPLRAIWWLLNVACLVALVRWGWRLAGGGTLEGTARPPAREHIAVILG